MDSTKVDLQRLKAVICRLIDELASQTGSESFQLPETDFYWTIPAEMKLVGEGQQPSTLHVGRLRDDPNDRRSTHESSDDPVLAD
jgi:hypothetical protein